jgi:hypothetical protein
MHKAVCEPFTAPLAPKARPCGGARTAASARHPQPPPPPSREYSWTALARWAASACRQSEHQSARAPGACIHRLAGQEQTNTHNEQASKREPPNTTVEHRARERGPTRQSPTTTRGRRPPHPATRRAQLSRSRCRSMHRRACRWRRWRWPCIYHTQSHPFLVEKTDHHPAVEIAPRVLSSHECGTQP